MSSFYPLPSITDPVSLGPVAIGTDRGHYALADHVHDLPALSVTYSPAPGVITAVDTTQEAIEKLDGNVGVVELSTLSIQGGTIAGTVALGPSATITKQGTVTTLFLAGTFATLVATGDLQLTLPPGLTSDAASDIYLDGRLTITAGAQATTAVKVRISPGETFFTVCDLALVTPVPLDAADVTDGHLYVSGSFSTL